MERTSRAYAIPLNSAWELSVHPVADPGAYGFRDLKANILR